MKGIPVSNRELGDNAARLVRAKAVENNASGRRRIRDSCLRAQLCNALMAGEKTDIPCDLNVTTLEPAHGGTEIIAGARCSFRSLEWYTGAFGSACA